MPDRATVSLAMLPEAPARFSTTMFCPSPAARCPAVILASASSEVPGLNSTISRMLCVGHTEPSLPAASAAWATPCAMRIIAVANVAAVKTRSRMHLGNSVSGRLIGIVPSPVIDVSRSCPSPGRREDRRLSAGPCQADRRERAPPIAPPSEPRKSP